MYHCYAPLCQAEQWLFMPKGPTKRHSGNLSSLWTAPIPVLSHDGRRVDSDGGKANMQNSFFYSCFRQSYPPVAECYPPYFSCPDDVLCSEQEVCVCDLEIDSEIDSEYLHWAITTSADHVDTWFEWFLNHAHSCPAHINITKIPAYYSSYSNSPKKCTYYSKIMPA